MVGKTKRVLELPFALCEKFCKIAVNHNSSSMTDFNSLRGYFSAEDEGAQDLTEQEFLDLNRKDAETYIGHVKNAKIKSNLQKIYDKAHPLSQGNCHAHEVVQPFPGI